MSASSRPCPYTASLRASRVPWVGRRLDLRSAYRQVPLRPDGRWVAVVCLLDPGNSEVPGLFLSLTLPFGAKSSVFIFNRLARGLWHSACTMLKLVALNYVDDYPCFEPAPTASNAQESFQLFLQLLGWEVSLGEKALPHSSEFEILGVILELHLHEVPGFVKISCKPGRMDEILKQVDAMISDGTISRGALAKLLGRLNFIRSQVLGRFIEPVVTIMSCKMAGRWRA
eukprot:6471643-Amphidinium_carterae.1